MFDDWLFGQSPLPRGKYVVGAPEPVWWSFPFFASSKAAADLLLHLEADGVEARSETHSVSALVVRGCMAHDTAVPREDERDVLRGAVTRLPCGAHRHDRASRHLPAKPARSRGRTGRRD